MIERGQGVSRLRQRRARPISTAWPGSGAPRSATATRSWSRPRRRRCASSPFGHLFAGKSHDPAIELAEKLKEIAPVPTSKVFFCNSGSEANDTQVKLVWYMNNALGRPRKKKIISRLKAYHGVTIAAASLTGLPDNQPRFRPADRRHPAHRLPASLPLRARRRERGGVRDAAGAPSSSELIQREGPGHRRRLHRRAGDGRGRRDRAARRPISTKMHDGLRASTTST